MKVSILVPIYNVDLYIERCARSLFEQTYREIEYLFIDDCTPDKSISILKDVMAQYPERASHVTIIRHDINRGLAAARNTAVANCKTEWLLHVDSDDWLERNAVELLVNKQDETGADIVSGRAMRHTPEGKEIFIISEDDERDKFILSVLGYDFKHVIWNRLIRSSLYDKGRIRAEEGTNLGEDLQVMPRLAWNAQLFSHIGVVTYHYDCMNTTSYVYNKEKNYRRNALEQDYRSLEIVKDFFADKDLIYKNRIAESEEQMLYSQLYIAAHNSDKEHYQKVRRLLCHVGDYLPESKLQRGSIKTFVENHYTLLRMSFPVRRFLVRFRSKR